MIFCYSGTGNSYYIAQRIADELHENIIDLNEKIKTDLVSAMKSHDTFKVSVLRMLKSELQLESINLQKELTDDEIKVMPYLIMLRRLDVIIHFLVLYHQKYVPSICRSSRKTPARAGCTPAVLPSACGIPSTARRVPWRSQACCSRNSGEFFQCVPSP